MSTENATDAEVESIDVDNSPVTITSVAAIGAAVVAALTSAPFGIMSIPLGFAGIALVGYGLYVKEERKWVSFGAASLVLAIIISGTLGAPLEFLLVSMIGTILAWDFGQNAIGLGQQIGRESETRRNELIHMSASLIVAGAAAALGYGVYALSAGGQPVSGLSMLVLALLLMLWAIRT